MILAYVAGPFSASTPAGVEANIRAAEEVGRGLAELGIMPVIPHSIGRNMQGTHSYEFWIEGTMTLMHRCDWLVLAPGWAASQGARLEHNEWIRRRGFDVGEMKTVFVWLIDRDLIARMAR